MNHSLSIVILAAGEGSRMCSEVPKVLHCVGGKSLLTHIVDTVGTLSPEKVYVIFGKDRPEVKHTLPHLPVTWIQQDKQLGTAHAVEQALPHVPDDHRVMILYGDGPLITARTLQQLVETDKNSIAWLSAEVTKPQGLGRIVRDETQTPVAIIEDKDADENTKQICEINTGISLVPARYLKQWIPVIEKENAAGEYYLTSLFEMAIQNSVPLHVIETHDETEVQGVNDRLQLALAERVYQMRQVDKLMKQGVTVRDPNRLDIRGEVTVGRDVTIDVNVILEGHVTLGDGVVIGPNVILRDATIHNNAIVKANSLVEQAEVGAHCHVGPFARIRPDTKLAEHVSIGNFVEVKNSSVGAYTKINHLSYVGDAKVGVQVNIGAGTITCNYDGANKNTTVIEDEAFVGANNSLIAPVTIGAKATTGSGSTINKDAPAGELTVARAKQVTVKGWKRPVKKNKQVNKDK